MAPQSFDIEVDPGKRGQLLRDRANPGEGRAGSYAVSRRSTRVARYAQSSHVLNWRQTSPDAYIQT
jgi:hypothetical protein